MSWFQKRKLKKKLEAEEILRVAAMSVNEKNSLDIVELQNRVRYLEILISYFEKDLRDVKERLDGYMEEN